MSYTIWLMPQEENTQEYLTSVITDLARKYEGPLFEPHTTLLGDINLSIDDVKVNCKKLAESIKPFQVETGVVEYSTTYYQCVFVRLKPIPALMTLYDKAKQVFGLTHPTVFMPHISLFYGTISYVTRHTIIKSVKFKPQSFTISSLVIAPGGENPPSAWKHLSEFPFTYESQI